ncbi:MAG: NADH:flavin oxidoreductase [Chloroflexi bacterium]|nr:NADH:flavin oxidoreductase [Chloroflexota bacterium]
MSLLFTPLKIRDLTLPNRLVLPPMVRFSPPMSPEVTNTDGAVTPALIEHYRQRAAAGTGLIIVEATCVDPEGRNWKQGLNAYDDSAIAPLAQLAGAIRAEGSVAAIQIVHGGPQSSPALTGRPPVGPSALQANASSATPRALSIAEIEAIQERFSDAAERVVAAGFQVVEVHGAHGYLLDSFLSRARNQRSDAYGGDVPGRARFMVETCARVMQRVAGRALVTCRFSLFNKEPGEFEAAEIGQLVAGLESANLDLLDLSTNGVYRPWPGAGQSLGRIVRSQTRLPVIAASGLVTPQDAERALAEGHADLAAVGRAALTDPLWATHAREALAQS